MQIELINTSNMAERSKQVEYSMLSIRLDGYDYVIYADSKHKDRLYLDVYKGKVAESTSYNGLIPKQRSIVGYLANRYSDYKTWLYNVMINPYKQSK